MKGRKDNARVVCGGWGSGCPDRGGRAHLCQNYRPCYDHNCSCGATGTGS